MLKKKNQTMLARTVVWSSLVIFIANCRVHHLVSPTYQQFSKYDFNKTKMFSSMSPYTMEEQCAPVRAWLLTRHGKKYPSRDILSGVQDGLVAKVRAKIVEVYEDPGNFGNLRKNQKMIVEALRKWENVMNRGTHKSLNSYGKLCMVQLGERLNDTLRPLSKQLNNDNVEVVTAAEERCVISGKTFLNAFLNGEHDEIVIRSQPDERLKLTKAPDDEIKIDNPEKPGEKIFAEDYFYEKNCHQTKDRIQKLLFPDRIADYKALRALITNDMVKTIYYACTYGYYYADNNGDRTDAWCLLFTFDDLQMFEAMHDLKYYHTNGYHLEYNTKLGNPLAADILQYLINPGDKKFKLFVGHRSNCLSLITRFGLFRDDEKLTVDNVRKMASRKWKTSFVSPYGCNIMVVVYDCGHSTLRVSLYLNEVAITMVLEKGQECVRCPIDEVIGLMISYNTSERPATETVTAAKDKKDKVKVKSVKKRPGRGRCLSRGCLGMC